MIQYLTVEQVAQNLSLSPWTIRQMVHKGEIPAIKIRRRWRFDPDKVQRKIEKQQSILAQP